MITIRPPGDKSISHRALLVAAVAGGRSELRGLGDGADVRSTIGVVRALGATVDAVEGAAGIDAAVSPSVPERSIGFLDCGNSGTTARLTLGLLAGLGVGARIDGDGSLRGRPMRRVVYPLQAMGARIGHDAEPNRLPVTVQPRATGTLRTLRHRPRVASAQVKSAILLAGVLDDVAVEVREPARSRDHTERMLAACGAPVVRRLDGEGAVASFEPGGWSGMLRPIDLEIPGDPSSAAFMIGAALLARRPIRIERVSDNPTRNGVLEVLEEMGATVARADAAETGGEPVCTWIVHPPDRLRGFDLGGSRIAGLIDELPLLSILATRAVGRSSIRDAAELRVKESDRIARLASNLVRLGVRVSERPDGIDIDGTTARLSGGVESGGDHRIAMAFGVLGASPASDIDQTGRECAGISYPRFWEDLRRVTAWRS